MSCFMSPTDVTIRYATSMSCSLPPSVSPPTMPYHHPVPYTLFDIPPCHMSHTPPPSVSPCDATCRDHAIQSAYVFFMRDVFGTPCFIAWYVFVVENVFNVLHHPRVTCHPKSPCFARAWLCCFMSHVIHLLCHIRVMLHSQIGVFYVTHRCHYPLCHIHVVLPATPHVTTRHAISPPCSVHPVRYTTLSHVTHTTTIRVTLRCDMS